jgi:beta-lactamase regulating signal transducer with metallopeptidase domain
MPPLTSLTAALETAFACAWRASWHAAAVAAIVLIVRHLAGRRLTPGWRCALWALVALRLLMPAAPQGTWSVFNLARAWPTNAPAVAPNASPGVATPAASPQITIRYGPAPFEPSSAAPVTRAEPQHPLPILPVLWLAGVALVFLRTVLAHRRVRRVVSAATPVTDPATLALLDRCRRQMRVTRPVRLLATDAVTGPALAGLRRPAILLPPGLADRLTPQQLSFVFLHELAHAKRLDLLGEWLIAALSALHWFNPLVWVAIHAYRADREAARDAMVLRATSATASPDAPADARAYGDTLLHLVHLAHSLPARRAVLNLLGMLSGRRRLHDRIAQIARFDPARRSVAATAAGCALLLTVGCWGLTDAKRPATTQASANSATAAATNPADDAADAADDPATRALLDRRLPQLTFDQVPLSDAIDALRTASGVNVVVNWSALEAAGVKRDAPVTARLRNVPFDKALRIVLSDAAGGKADLHFAADRGVVTVSTRDELDTVVTRVYDVRDLATAIPDFDADRDFPASGQPAPATTGPILPSPRPLPRSASPSPAATAPTTPAPPATLPTRDEATDRIMDLVRETVDPASWNAPGRPGAIRALSGQLIVTHRRDAHASVAALLAQLRETRAIQVMVEARFLAFDKAAVEHLPEPLRASVKTALSDGADKSAGVHLTDAQVAELLRAMQASADSTTLTAPRMTLFNGQRAYVAITTQQAYVADLKVVRGRDGKVSYDPVVEVTNSGLIMDVQATVSADRRYVTTTLRPRLSNLRRMDTVPFENVPDDQKNVTPKPTLTIQRPVVDVRQLKTTVSIPDHGTLLLPGGPLTSAATRPGAGGAGGGGGAAPTTTPVLSEIPLLKRLFTHTANAADPTLIILVKPTIVTQREPAQKPKP